jgi:hypothetical protein
VGIQCDAGFQREFAIERLDLPTGMYLSVNERVNHPKAKAAREHHPISEAWWLPADSGELGNPKVTSNGV